MDNTTLLYVINPDTPDAEISAIAEAAQPRNVHLACLLLGEAPIMPFYAGMPAYSGYAISDDWPQMLREARSSLAARGDEVEKVLARSGVSADVISALCATGDLQGAASSRAMVCDNAYIAPNIALDSTIFREVVYGILFGSPVGLILNKAPLETARQVFVAWDTSLAAARAVHAALPQLKAAKEVLIGSFDPVMSPESDGENPGSDLAKWLSHHGCNVTLSQYPSGGRDIASCIAERAQEAGSDMIVMGAYGHSRLRQAVLGGTTRTMIENTDLKLFLAH